MGFTKVPNELIKDKSLTAYEKLILIYVLSFKGCWTSHQRMALELGISVGSVKNAARSLELKGLLFIFRKTGKTNLYSAEINSYNPATTCLPPSHHMANTQPPHSYPPSHQVSTNKTNTNKTKVIRLSNSSYGSDKEDFLKEERRKADKKAHDIYLETLRLIRDK